MAGRIPQDFIDELVNRADIVEVVGSRLQLKKAGREYKAVCPFHNEKTPSFTLSPDKGFYHCFGCGAHGTALGFLMEHDRLEFRDAVEELAALCSMEVPTEESGAPISPTAPLFGVLEKAADYFCAMLRDNQTAIDYLKDRGLDGETVRDYRIGYAPNAWDAVLGKLGSTPELRQHLLAAGLVIKRDDDRVYDRFRDRIMFPIRDARGRIIGFGGRVLGDGEPKYLNSPETPVFHKGRELYGLYECRQATRHPERILIVEGYMDTVALARHGITNAVATLGTATTAEHLRRVFRVCSEIVFCFDGDRAGRAAAWRALEVSLPELRDGRQVRFMFLPDGQDPDSLVNEIGHTAFSEQVEASVPLSEYLIDHLTEDADMDSIDGKARFGELARPLISRVPEGIYRELLTNRIADLVGLRREHIARRLSPGEESRRAGPATRKTPARGRSTHVRHALRQLLHHPTCVEEVRVPDALPGLSEQPGVALLLETIAFVSSNPGHRTAAIVEHFRDHPEGRHLERLLAGEMLVAPDQAAAELEDTLHRIVADARSARLEELVARAKDGPLDEAEKEEFRALQSAVAQAPRGSGTNEADS